jgi:cobalt/nickel transport system permease protein/energy-coupling factor transport system permease protein
MFGGEIILAILIKINVDRVIPVLKFLLINLIPIYLLFYFVDFDWIIALRYFGEFTSKIFVLLISLLLFVEVTPLSTLVTSLSKIGFPKRLTFVVVVGINFIPLISAQLRKVVQFQKARGYKVRLFKLKPILVPVITNILDLSLNISLSLESRGLEL